MAGINTRTLLTTLKNSCYTSAEQIYYLGTFFLVFQCLYQPGSTLDFLIVKVTEITLSEQLHQLLPLNLSIFQLYLKGLSLQVLFLEDVVSHFKSSRLSHRCYTPSPYFFKQILLGMKLSVLDVFNTSVSFGGVAANFLFCGFSRSSLQ